MSRKLAYVICFMLIFSMVPICSFAGTNEQNSMANYQIMPRWAGVKAVTNSL